jgi:hypothetical protein
LIQIKYEIQLIILGLVIEEVDEIVMQLMLHDDELLEDVFELVDDLKTTVEIDIFKDQMMIE